MHKLIKEAVTMSVYHIALLTVSGIEANMKKEDPNGKSAKQKILLLSTVHTLLGAIYND